MIRLHVAGFADSKLSATYLSSEAFEHAKCEVKRRVCNEKRSLRPAMAYCCRLLDFRDKEADGMRVKNDKLEIPVEASSALSIVKNCFGTALLGVYLHGSAVSGGLRPNSDVDLLAIVSRPTTHADRKRLVTELLSVSGRYPHDDAGRRPLELIVFNRADLATSAYPARSEFVYGEWLRDAFETGEVPEPVSDPEFTLLLAQARQEARALIGPDPAELLPVIPESDIRRAIGDALPSLLGTLEGDERNVLLTLARMWRTLVTGEFVPKDAAAQWAMPRLPDIAATLLASAREGYLSRTAYDWSVRRIEARRVADELGERVAALLSHNSCRLSKNPD